MPPFQPEGNDGIVTVKDAILSWAEFKPVVYAFHQPGGELSLLGSTYVTEFIKAWIIDDDYSFQGAACQGSPYLYTYHGLIGALGGDRAVRICPNVNDFEKVLAVVVSPLYDEGGNVSTPPNEWKGYALRYYKEGCPGEPVYVISHPWNIMEYFCDILVYDLNGRINLSTEYKFDHLIAGEPKVTVTSPQAGEWYKPGQVIPIKWESNDEAVKQDLYISYDGGEHWKEIAKDLPGDVREYNYRLEDFGGGTDNCMIKVKFYLDPFIYIEGKSQKFCAGWWLQLTGWPGLLLSSLGEYFPTDTFDTVFPTATSDTCTAWLEWEWNWGPGQDVFRYIILKNRFPIDTVEPYIHNYTTTTRTAWFEIKAECEYDTVLSNPVLIFCPSKPPPDTSGCPFIYVWNGSSYEIDNNILRVEILDSAQYDYLDFYKLNHIPSREDGKYLLKIKEFEQEHSYINQVLLHAVDHPQGTEIGVTGYGKIIVYDPASVMLPVDAKDIYTHDILPYLTNEDDLFFAGKAGEWITVKFPCSGYRLTGGEIYLGIRDRARDKRSIIVEVYENTAWKMIGVLHPRENWQYEFLPLTSSIPGDTLILRLKFTSYHELDKVFLVNSSGNGIIKECPLDFAFHSVEGDITQEIKNSDDMYAELMPGEEISLSFTAPSLPEKNMKRDFIFISSGYYEVMDGYGGPQEVIKSSFSFRLYSIPVVVGRKSIEMKYSLPYKSQVRVCVYDVNGRLIKEIFKEER